MRGLRAAGDHLRHLPPARASAQAEKKPHSDRPAEGVVGQAVAVLTALPCDVPIPLQISLVRVNANPVDIVPPAYADTSFMTLVFINADLVDI